MICFFRLFSIAVVLAMLVLRELPAAETNTAPASAPRSEEITTETLRTYLQLQEQLHATQLAIERNRKEAESAASQTAQALSGRLDAIEEAFSKQSTTELELMHGNNRIMLILAGTFAGAGLIALVLMVWFQSRAVNRLAEISAVLPRLRETGAGPYPALLGPGETMPSIQAQESSARMLGALTRLEQRIAELEDLPAHGHQAQALHAGTAEETTGNGNSHGKSNGSKLHVLEPSGCESLLLKGQGLLNQDRVKEALACFEEALAENPDHAEALVKKGTALDKLGMLQDAIECYDRAITLNSSLTVAYLHKGGLCNRMERFSEALECYEQALKTQEKGSGA